MKKLEFKLKIHTPWHVINNINAECNDLLEIQKSFKENYLSYHLFNCGDFCNIEINNAGNVIFTFFNDVKNDIAHEFVALFVYYISILNGFNCEISTNCKIDNNPYKNYFSFPKEDKASCILMKNIKFYEISLESIKNTFGRDMYKLYCQGNKDFMLNILANYYSTVLYKDFPGNLEYKFRNIITNIEALISLIYKEQYEKIRLQNKQKIKEFKITINDIDKYVLPKSVSLQNKLKDMFSLFFELFGLTLKNNLNQECEKLANSRNFISHLFDKECIKLTYCEMNNYTRALPEVFRMLFLYYLGYDKEFIKIKFFRSLYIQKRFSLIFSTT